MVHHEIKFVVVYCRVCKEMMSFADLEWSDDMCIKCFDFDYGLWVKMDKLREWWTEPHYA